MKCICFLSFREEHFAHKKKNRAANLLMLAAMLAHVGCVPGWRYFALQEMGLRHIIDNVILQVKKCEVSLFQSIQ